MQYKSNKPIQEQLLVLGVCNLLIHYFSAFSVLFSDKKCFNLPKTTCCFLLLVENGLMNELNKLLVFLQSSWNDFISQCEQVMLVSMSKNCCEMPTLTSRTWRVQDLTFQYSKFRTNLTVSPQQLQLWMSIFLSLTMDLAGTSWV